MTEGEGKHDRPGEEGIERGQEWKRRKEIVTVSERERGLEGERGTDWTG